MDNKQEEKHLAIHMLMLSKSEDSEKIEGSWTVIKLGFAVTEAEKLIKEEVLSVLDEIYESKRELFGGAEVISPQAIKEIRGRYE